jgi:hypothetical protein
MAAPSRRALLLALIVTFIASCGKPRDSTTASAPPVFSSLDGRQRMTIRSRTELELLHDGANLICTYDKTGGSMRVIAEINGTKQALYFTPIEHGFRSQDGIALLDAEGLASARQLESEREEQRRQLRAKEAQAEKKKQRDISLVTAAAMTDLPRMRKLLEEGADVNGRSPSGDPVLIWVCSGQVGAIGEFSEAAKLLINHGCDVNAQAPDGKTALWLVINTKERWAPLSFARRSFPCC